MPPKRSLRIALLLADTPNPYVLAEHGTYLDVFRTHLLASLAYLGRADEVDLEVVGFDIVHKGDWPSEEGFEKAEWDGVMITGSAHCSYDDIKNPWVPKTLNFIRLVADKYPNVKIIGTCFGMQLLVRAFGGSVIKNPAGWEIGTYSLSLTPIGSQLLSSSSPSSSPPLETIAIQQMHADYAPSLPPKGKWEWQLLGSTPKCEVQGLVHFDPQGKVRMLGWEGHPEFNQSIVDKINKFRTDSGVFTAEMSAEATRRAAEPHDGRGAVGGMMLRILLGEL